MSCRMWRSWSGWVQVCCSYKRYRQASLRGRTGRARGGGGVCQTRSWLRAECEWTEACWPSSGYRQASLREVYLDPPAPTSPSFCPLPFRQHTPSPLPPLNPRSSGSRTPPSPFPPSYRPVPHQPHPFIFRPLSPTSPAITLVPQPPTSVISTTITPRLTPRCGTAACA